MSDNTLGNLESTSRNVKEITEYDIDKVAGVETTEEVREKLEATKIEEGVLITYDQLVVNFLQQYEDAKADLLKMQSALDNLHYTSTVTKISLKEMQDKKDFMHQLHGAIEALYLYQKHVDPNVTDKPWTFEDPEYDETTITADATTQEG